MCGIIQSASFHCFRGGTCFGLLFDGQREDNAMESQNSLLYSLFHVF